MDACCCSEYEKTCMVFLKVKGGVLIRINEQCSTIQLLDRMCKRGMQNVQLREGGDLREHTRVPSL